MTMYSVPNKNMCSVKRGKGEGGHLREQGGLFRAKSLEWLSVPLAMPASYTQHFPFTLKQRPKMFLNLPDS